jgi:hypothetical protein
MNCQEASEFVSAFWDRETIPRDAAEHIRTCEACRALLSEYAEMSRELRQVASLEAMGETKAGRWERAPGNRSWWWKGWETMRVPRLLFALLVMAVVVLGSSLVMVRARNQGSVLMLTAKTSNGWTIHCALSLTDAKAASCETFGQDHSFGFRVITENGDRIQLGVRVGPGASSLKTPPPATVNLSEQEERQYWLEPGKELDIVLPEGGSLMVTGRLMDHMPSLPTSPDEQLDPNPGALRFVSPVLLRDGKVVTDLEDASATADKNGAIELYVPGDALYLISLAPMEGAVVGNVRVGRISFAVDGHSYKFLLALPVTRAERIWVLRDGNYKPPTGLQDGFLGTHKLN